jgi:hypothetical protein
MPMQSRDVCGRKAENRRGHMSVKVPIAGNRSGPSGSANIGGATTTFSLSVDGYLISHRERNFANKSIFAPVKANLPLLLDDHLFDDTCASKFLRRCSASGANVVINF